MSQSPPFLFLADSSLTELNEKYSRGTAAFIDQMNEVYMAIYEEDKETERLNQRYDYYRGDVETLYNFINRIPPTGFLCFFLLFLKAAIIFVVLFI